jgi:endo-1,4-beta-xylanase
MRVKLLVSGLVGFMALAGCGKSGPAQPSHTGGATSTTASGGQTQTGGGGDTTNSGGTVGSGGATGTGGSSANGGITGSGGRQGTGGATGSGGASASGGVPGSGGTTPGSGGTTSTTAAGGTTGRDGGPDVRPGTGGAGTAGISGAGGMAATGGASATGGATSTSTSTVTVDCNATMPTGGTTKSGTNVNGTANGLNYGIWTNGSGGTITYFTSAHAFAASWDNSQDFLAHLGLDFNGSKSYTAYGTIAAQFVEQKTGTAGGFSMIGMYGWMHSPCVEWYINEDSFNGLYGRGSVTAVIDGETYYLSTSTTTGTGGANACESGHTGSWTNMTSTRKTARQCGTVTVSDHFAAWAAQGWSLGNLASVHINVEVGGGTGSIQFPVADVTTTSK